MAYLGLWRIRRRELDHLLQDSVSLDSDSEHVPGTISELDRDTDKVPGTGFDSDCDDVPGNSKRPSFDSYPDIYNDSTDSEEQTNGESGQTVTLENDLRQCAEKKQRNTQVCQ